MSASAMSCTAMAANKLGTAYGIEAPNTLSTVLIFGSALLVSTAIVLAAVCRLRGSSAGTMCRLTTS
jgi:hypothetical protein